MHGHDLMISALAFHAGFAAGRYGPKGDAVAENEFINFVSRTMIRCQENADANRPASGS